MNNQSKTVITNLSISTNPVENINRLKDIFKQCADIAYERIAAGPDMSCTAWIVYCESLADQQSASDILSVLQKMEMRRRGNGDSLTTQAIREWFEFQGIIDRSYFIHDTLESVVRMVLQGHVVFFMEQWDHAVSFDGLKLETRGVDEPSAERAAIGPREGTVENLSMNIGMLRLRLKTPDFKIVKIPPAGPRSGKEIVYGYMDGVVPPAVLQQFEQRIGKVKDYEIIDTTMVEKLIQDSVWSPFPQCRFTERTDAAALAVLEGELS